MVFNMGIWHKEGDWDHPSRKEFDDYRDELDRQVEEFGQYYLENKNDLPLMVWKDTITQHKHMGNPQVRETAWLATLGCLALAHHGSVPLQWPFACQPLDIALDNNGFLYGNDEDKVTGGWQNRITGPYMKSLGLSCVETWNQTAVLHYMHR
eukprot:scaffold98266_cov29-Prasinocladus_malaysianus.AAC.1